MSKNFSIVLVAAAIVAVGFAVNARAELLFNDNFDGVTNPGSGDYGLNDNLGNRLTGAVTTGPTGMIATGSAWARDYRVNNVDGIQVNSSHGTDMLACSGGGGTTFGNAALIQHNFNYAGGFTLRFDMDPVAEASADNLHGHAGHMFFGADDATQSYLGTTDHKTEYDLSVDLALHFSDYGKLRVRWMDSTSNLNDSDVYGNKGNGKYYTNEIVYDSARTVYSGLGNNSPDYAQIYTFEVRVTTEDYLESTLASMELWIMDKDGETWPEDGVVVDLNGSLAGNAVTFHWDDGEANYIGFGDQPYNTTWTQIDNVAVYGEIPEPSTLALLGCGLLGLLAYAWRKRK